MATVARAECLGQQAEMPFNLDHLPGSGPRPGPREIIALLAGLMALNAFAIDAMIPALPQIGQSLHVAHENDQQLVVVAYFLGFASTQLIWGPLADRFGRKPILALGVILYIFFAALCAIAGSFPLLIAGRVAMGASAAVTRVLVVAMVRDLFEGEAMARIMSLVFMVFMVVPVLAPSIGQLVLLFAPWRAIFVALACYAVIMFAWSWFRLPETLHPEYRRALAPREIASAIGAAIKDPLSRGYTLALTATFGALVAYISSIQQIIAEAFHRPEILGLAFGAIAAPMAAASWTNARFIGRFGLRRVGHSATVAFALVALLHTTAVTIGIESLALFVVLQSLTMACFAFASSNLSTLAMGRMAEIAGTASSVQGVVSTVGAALIGYVIGQAFDGTVRPFLWGMSACAISALIIIALTEPKRLFAGPSAAGEQLAPNTAAEA
jgi:DHA1 family bicyclomycin/chloramphenicol resistance-like MFS transporter